MAALEAYVNGPEAEPIQLTVRRFLDTDGKPTCCTDVPRLEVCMFLRTSHYGSRNHCNASETLVHDSLGGYRGWLRPNSNCPLWQAGAEEEASGA